VLQHIQGVRAKLVLDMSPISAEPNLAGVHLRRQPADKTLLTPNHNETGSIKRAKVLHGAAGTNNSRNSIHEGWAAAICREGWPLPSAFQQAGNALPHHLLLHNLALSEISKP
jgi:hypothetical protein